MLYDYYIVRLCFMLNVITFSFSRNTLLFARFTESVRTNMGRERVRDIQKDDDTKELGASTAGAKYDRTKVRSDTCLPRIRD